MMSPVLRAVLRPLARRQWRLQLSCRLAVCWTGAALVGLLLILWQRKGGAMAVWAAPLLALLAVGVAVRVFTRQRRIALDYSTLARQIEATQPGLQGLLLTAMQQEPNAGQPAYFRQRVVAEAVRHSFQHDWAAVVPRSRELCAHATNMIALGLLVWVLSGIRTSQGNLALLTLGGAGVAVTPGDTSLERGSSLLVLARFGNPLPAKVELVGASASGPGVRIAMVKNLADPVFGGSVPELAEDLVYHVEYDGQKTRDFRATVFEYPRLVRADAQLDFPSYTGQASRRIADTRRLSAVEGSRLDLDLQLNKPVVSAQLLARGKERKGLPLIIETNRAAVALRRFVFADSRTWDLQLVDAEGRTNKVPATFVFEVLTNRIPELRVALPRGDSRPSALEEVAFEGTVWDDFGTLAYGLAYSVAGGEPVIVELGRAVPAGEKRPFRHLLRLEDVGVKPDDLVAWHVWADDTGPDGLLRRNAGELFFAEIRPFEEIFRESQGGGASQPDQAGQEQNSGSPAARLVELQKQIITASWKLQRQPGARGVPGAGSGSATYANDALVVRDSQAQALDQAEDELDQTKEVRTAGLWREVTKQMGTAVTHLTTATNSPTALAPALAAEQAAYQGLLKLQQREYAVARNRNRGQGAAGGSRGQQMQRQLDQLDLTQSEDRYETQRQAQAPPSAERREQLQVMSRLEELARRQQDVNERLKELQTALQEARTEPEREEARRRLKRLQEEQQQLLSGADELRQRLERPENQSRMAESRQQLDQSREEMQRAAEAAGRGQVSQALAAGARAQSQMQQMRDEMRRQNASAFEEDLREMRGEARELARGQQDIQRQVDELAAPRRPTLSNADGQERVLDRLAQQKRRLTNLVDRATQVSQQAEGPEPIMSRELYDAVRKFSQDEAGAVKEFQEELLNRGLLSRSLQERLRETAESDGAKSLEMTAEMLRRGYLPQAGEAEQRARAGIANLQRGVERAAERVLGDDAEALRQARQELERLTEELEQEIAAQVPGQARAPAAAPSGGGGQPGRPDDANPEPGADGPPAAQARPGNPGQTPASGQGRADASPTGTPRQASGGAAGERPATATGDRADNGRGGASPTALDQFLDGRGGTGASGPITGLDFAPWSDRLREVEEMVDLPTARNAIAAARERARQLRQDFKRDRQRPDWAIVRLQIVRPLVEVRDQIAEELARRQPRDQLVPIDRDPVPGRYSELVRRYYEDLAKEK